MERVETSRVLVVDDEPQITRVLKTVLTSQGFDVRTAPEGESALVNFREWSPELVITDPAATLGEGVVQPWNSAHVSDFFLRLLAALGDELGFDLNTP